LALSSGGEGRGEEEPVSSASHELISSLPPSKMFADITPVLSDPSDEELARRTFVAIQEQDQKSRRQSPTLYTVFQLYCMQEMTIPQIAGKCRCSIGTLANRLKISPRKNRRRRRRTPSPHPPLRKVQRRRPSSLPQLPHPLTNLNFLPKPKKGGIFQTGVGLTSA
jgi:hypothetical protein